MRLGFTLQDALPVHGALSNVCCRSWWSLPIFRENVLQQGIFKRAPIEIENIVRDVHRIYLRRRKRTDKKIISLYMMSGSERHMAAA